MTNFLIGIVVLVVAALVVIPQVFYVIREGEQGIVLQFGDPVRAHTEPGVYLKTPFIQDLTRFERRVLSRDVPPSEYLTLDRKRVVVDHVTRWRIVDPLRFREALGDEDLAVSRLDDLTASHFRSELARHNFVTIVRETRDQIMDDVTARVSTGAAIWGIEVVDVRIKRLDLPGDVQDSVFARMRAERHRQAEGFRAEGEELSREIRANADRQHEVIVAQAYAESQRMRGEGDAVAIDVTGRAFGQDAEFYAFMRRMEAYETILTPGTTIVLSPDSDLFRYLESPITPAIPTAGSP